MTQSANKLLLCLLLLEIAHNNFNLIYSNTTDTILYFPGPERSPIATWMAYCGGLGKSTIIWDSNVNTRVIEVKNTFRIRCLTQTLYLSFQVDNDIWYKL
jgi:hypothetical protein